MSALCRLEETAGPLLAKKGGYPTPIPLTPMAEPRSHWLLREIEVPGLAARTLLAQERTNSYLVNNHGKSLLSSTSDNMKWDCIAVC